MAPGLRRWSAWHSEWRQEVGSVAVDTTDGLVLIDPLDPPPEVRSPAHVLLTVFWHARTAGDLGAGAKPHATSEPLRLCPENWLEGATTKQLIKSLLPLLDLPLERILVSHGDPVLQGGKDVLRNLIAPEKG